MRSEARGGVWADAGALIARGELAAAADLLGEKGLHTEEAYARLRAAETLTGAARAAQLEPALAFYRSVGASLVRAARGGAARRVGVKRGDRYVPQRRNSTVCAPRFSQSWMPPWRTGRAFDAARAEDARRDRRTRAGVADRHDGLLAEAVVAHAQQPVRDVARPRDVAAVALVLLAHVEHLDLAGGEQALDLVELDRRDALVARRVELVAGDVEQRDGPQASRRAFRLVDARRVDRDRLVRRQEERALRRERRAVDRNVDRAVRVPRGERVGVADVEDRRRGGVADAARAPSATATNGPRFSATMRSMFGGRSCEPPADASTNSSSSAIVIAWLNRRSKPIVDDAFELMPTPHREPAT